MNEVITCDECAYGIFYDDWTHLTLRRNEDDASEHLEEITERLSEYGLLEHKAQTEGSDFWTCEACQGNCFEGEQHTFVPVR